MKKSRQKFLQEKKNKPKKPKSEFATGLKILKITKFKAQDIC